jgi:hypothetical protein
MLIITEDAKLVCKHELGKVGIIPTQSLVTINQRRVLVEPNPEGRPISGCPLMIPFKPCLFTLKVRAGYSRFMRIAGMPICLDSVVGLTDGTPPGIVEYKVNEAGQAFVCGAA